MNRQEAVEILMEQADYWRSLIKRNGIDGYPGHRLHTVVAGLDWAVDYMSGNAGTPPADGGAGAAAERRGGGRMTREEAAGFTRKLLEMAEINAFPGKPKRINNIPVFYFEAVLAALREKMERERSEDTPK